MQTERRSRIHLFQHKSRHNDGIKLACLLHNDDELRFHTGIVFSDIMKLFTRGEWRIETGWALSMARQLDALINVCFTTSRLNFMLV